MAKLPQVPEAEAQGAARAVFEAVKPALRASLVGSIFRAWASAPEFLERLWGRLEPAVRTRFFEAGADRVRERAVDLVDELVKPADHLPIMRAAGLTDREIGRIRDTLAVFHYLDPKLLIVAEAVRLAWRGEAPAAAPPAPAGAFVPPPRQPGRRPEDSIPAGVPDGMLAPGAAAGAGGEPGRTILSEITSFLGAAETPDDFLALAAFPGYLDLAWRELKPVIQKESFGAAVADLRKTAAEVARGLPRPLAIDREELARLAGAERGAVAESIDLFPRLGAALALSVALLAQSLYGGEIARRPPFPIDPGRSRRRAPAQQPPERKQGA
jgi:hypothetical protein